MRGNRLSFNCFLLHPWSAICFNSSNLRLYTWPSICKNKKYTCYHDDSFYLLAWCRWSRDPEPPLAFMTFSFIVAPDPVGQDPIPSPQDKRKEATILRSSTSNLPPTAVERPAASCESIMWLLPQSTSEATSVEYYSISLSAISMKFKFLRVFKVWNAL